MPTPLCLRRRSRRLFLLLLPLLALGQACGGNPRSGDHAGQANTAIQILPANPTVIASQSIQLQISGGWGTGAQWSVQPASAGTITAGGLFTASAIPGTCTIFAVWAQDVRYTAEASLTSYPAPPPAVSSPSFVQDSGSQQATPGGTVTNGCIVGEPVPASVSSSADQTLQNRQGFTPPAPTS